MRVCTATTCSQAARQHAGATLTDTANHAELDCNGQENASLRLKEACLFFLRLLYSAHVGHVALSAESRARPGARGSEVSPRAHPSFVACPPAFPSSPNTHTAQKSESSMGGAAAKLKNIQRESPQGEWTIVGDLGSGSYGKGTGASTVMFIRR